MSFYISRKLSFASTRLFIFDYKLFIVNYQSNMKIKKNLLCLAGKQYVLKRTYSFCLYVILKCQIQVNFQNYIPSRLELASRILYR